ncbi:MAG: oligosaccharide flippase family protein, partial [Planctomycetia bacterium]
MESQARSPATNVPARVWSGTRWLVLGRLYGSLCTLIALWWIARVLDEEAFGRYGFYLSMFVVLDTLCDFGTG